MARDDIPLVYNNRKLYHVQGQNRVDVTDDYILSIQGGSRFITFMRDCWLEQSKDIADGYYRMVLNIEGKRHEIKLTGTEIDFLYEQISLIRLYAKSRAMDKITGLEAVDDEDDEKVAGCEFCLDECDGSCL